MKSHEIPLRSCLSRKFFHAFQRMQSKNNVIPLVEWRQGRHHLKKIKPICLQKVS